MSGTEARKEELKPVLLVDDSDADAKLLAHAFEKVGVSNPLVHLSGGQALLDYVGNLQGDDSEETLPAIIILDINMPGISGIEVLSKLKATPRVKRIPIVIMSNSADAKFVDDCYENGANAYVNKPPEFTEICDVVRAFSNQWLQGASLLSIW